MVFQIEKSTIPAAVGAGAAPPKFIDYTHRLRFENPESGDTAEALATFGDGDELHEVRLWAERAHGLDLLEVEKFDAKAEQKARKAAAEALAADLAEAQTEAERIVAHARQEGEAIIQDARTQADDILADAARIRQEAADDAAEVRALEGFGPEEEEALAAAEGDQAGDEAEATEATQADGEGTEGGKGPNRRRR